MWALAESGVSDTAAGYVAATELPYCGYVVALTSDKLELAAKAGGIGVE